MMDLRRCVSELEALGVRARGIVVRATVHRFHVKLTGGKSEVNAA